MHVLCAVEIIICKACLQANIVVSRCEEPNPNFKLQRLLYLVHGALPLLWPTSCLEQDLEIEMEAESQGLERAEVNIRRIKLDEDEHPALLRPGRFDRKIRIRPPGAKGRLAILKVHARKVKMSPTVDLSSYAQNLPGWTGAKLAQLLQEAALVAVRRGHGSILQSDVDVAVDRLTVEPKRVEIELGHQGQCRRATTEVGTAMAAYLLKRYEDAKVESCERISIIPCGQVITSNHSVTLSQIVFHRLDDKSYIFERRPQLLHWLQYVFPCNRCYLAVGLLKVIYGRDTSRASVSYLADASWLARKILTMWGFFFGTLTKNAVTFRYFLFTVSLFSSIRWNMEKSMAIHGEPPPWRKRVSFVGPRLDFEGSLYDDYDLIEPRSTLIWMMKLLRELKS
ncbi:hypothetical protein IFM89_017043 [Coptis chinensis]|uniref:AAA ATPase AAA+ lid domain-containing protein n=1 Tax=Coptis chinensis TaxID=261450 RepID=A0A835HQ95_9MAGN|nr:hypothetical protein IFM89_017043 [Coptis chinensis]